MLSKTKASAAADKAVQLQIPAELLDQLVTGPMTAGQVQGLFDQFKKAVLERALAGEMSHHLGYAAGQAKPEGAAAKHRNGKSAKTVPTDAGALRLDIPRDREGTFEPQLIRLHVPNHRLHRIPALELSVDRSRQLKLGTREPDFQCASVAAMAPR